VCANTEEQETPLNLELLFNAVHAVPNLLETARQAKFANRSNGFA
jgi:hypothetical protein